MNDEHCEVQPTAFVLLRCGQAHHDVRELATAIAADPGWETLAPATLVVRTSPAPALVALGRFDESGATRLEALRWQLEHQLPSRLDLDYPDVESGCAELAARLRTRLGDAFLAEAQFVGIPRGGLIVLGMLAYLLELRHDQLCQAPSGGGERPVVVVDDCAISGDRFQRFLGELPSGPVVFAHLYSHPDLRSAIERSEARVEACVAARDLTDLAPSRLGDEYAAWRSRWLARQAGRGYWLGQPEHVCFPWNEPDVGVWNPVSEREEKGWSLVPPRRCLKHRGHEAKVEVQVFEPTSSLPEHMLYATFEGTTVLIDMRAGTCLALEGVASEMWHALVAGQDLDAASRALAQRYDVTPDVLRRDLAAFRDELCEAGCLA
jgi:hypothetical protein